MCGRITLTNPEVGVLPDVSITNWEGDGTWDASSLSPRFNIAPSQQHWIVKGGGHRGSELHPASWGLEGREGRKFINLRVETLCRYRGKLERAWRCVMPADGFYEWIGSRSARRPLWFHAPKGETLWMAGVYDQIEEGRFAFAVLTTRANPLVARAHNRMPVLIDPRDVSMWLDPDTPEIALRPMLQPAPMDALEVQPASMRVNNVSNDDPTCLDANRAQEQLALF